MRIEEIDSNFKTENALGLTDAVFLNVRNEPFDLYGLYRPHEEERFCRLPAKIGEATSPRVAELSYHTAGGRVRFSTDSPYIAIRCRTRNVTRLPHMAMIGSTGFDLYETRDGQDHYLGSFLPPVTMSDGTYATYTVHFDCGYSAVLSVGGGKMHSYTIHFPLYNDVAELEIGLQAEASVDHGTLYRPFPPFVTYGSSITQGGCASKPGNAYQNLLSALLNIDHINLGFSGSACGEQSMAGYLASLPMSLLIVDYDYNAPTVEHLQATHLRFVKTVRDAKPTLPILLLSRPSNTGTAEAARRREVIAETYRTFREQGDQNIYYIDGSTFFTDAFGDACTVDNVHPNDAGFVHMAEKLSALMIKIYGGTTNECQ